MMYKLAFVASLMCSAAGQDQPTVIVIVGAAGTEEYGEQFAEWADHWGSVAENTGARFVRIGLPSDQEVSDRDRLEQQLIKERDNAAPLWLVFIGHGTFNGRVANFNLRGPDVSATQLATWLKPLSRPLVIVNSASASGPFINKLSGADRVVITATKSGHEHQFARFGRYMSESIIDEEADLDKDNQTSLLEAFLLASRRVAEFYEQEARLATEHALLDDNGDGLGTPASWFRGIRTTRRGKDGAAPDGLRAHQFHLLKSTSEADLSTAAIEQRDELERQIAKLREQKPKMPIDQYYQQLEPLLIELARLYEDHESSQ